jgi:hypothetical protein
MAADNQTETAIRALRNNSGRLLLVVDLAGTLLFAVEGATTAVIVNLDLLGLMVLAFSTASAGGIIRDLLIGFVPPNALRDWRYPCTEFTGGAIVFLHLFIQGILTHTIMILDAAALALFAVAGTEKALNYQMSPLVAILLGTVTAVGGGTLRDIFLGAGSSNSQPGCVRNRGFRRISGYGYCQKTANFSNVGGNLGRCRLLFTTRGQRLAAVEFAKGIVLEPFGVEQVNGSSCLPCCLPKVWGSSPRSAF